MTAPNKHHDMMFGNFDDDPGAEFVFWNQGASQLSIVNVPADPRGTQPLAGRVGRLGRAIGSI
jgi:hypothetical protein